MASEINFTDGKRNLLNRNHVEVVWQLYFLLKLVQLDWINKLIHWEKLRWFTREKNNRKTNHFKHFVFGKHQIKSILTLCQFILQFKAWIWHLCRGTENRGDLCTKLDLSTGFDVSVRNASNGRGLLLQKKVESYVKWGCSSITMVWNRAFKLYLNFLQCFARKIH